jgi:hypothetical protein
MKVDRMTKVLLGFIVALLIITLVNSLFSSRPALATPGDEQKIRYMIAAWAVQPQNADPRSGYYVLDTATGRVVASKMEIHRTKE